MNQNQPVNLGRFVRKLNKRCPDCGAILSIRAKKTTKMFSGISFDEDIEIVQCSSCGYEEEVEQKKRKQKYDKETAWKEKSEKGGRDGGHKKRGGFGKGSGAKNQTGYGKNNR